MKFVHFIASLFVLGALDKSTVFADSAPTSDDSNQTGFHIKDTALYVRPMFRQSWSDILDYGSVASPAGNIQGATFSYSDDQLSHNTTFSAQGAAILSLSYLPVIRDASGWNLMQGEVGPTVAINRVSSSAKPTNNVDNLYFGIGGGLALLHSDTPDPLESMKLYGFSLRSAFVYNTDSKFNASLPGAIFEVEPQFLFRLVPYGATNAPFPWIALGRNNRIGSLQDGTAKLLFQTRAWLHLEGGDIQQNGTNWNVVPGSFFRMGPEVRGQVAIPKLNNFSLSAEYDYLPTISGPSGRNYLYKLAAAIPLTPPLDSPTAKQPVSLVFNYTDGGIILNKQLVKTFTIGVSVTY